MKKSLLSFAMLVLLSQAFAQNSLKQIIRGERGVSQHFTTLTQEQQRGFSVKQAASILELNNNSNLELLNQQTDKQGVTHYRFYQTYNGIPVENSMYIIHAKNGKMTGMSGEIIVDFDEYSEQSSFAKINDKQAIDAAIANVKAKIYMWQDAAMEQRIKDQAGDVKASYAPTAKLVWFSPTENLSPRDLKLAYKVDVYAKEPLSRADYFIDASTGKLLGKHDKLYFTDATGTAATAYSGSQTIHSDYTGTNYRLRDYTKGNGIITLHGETASRGTDYTSTTANWTLTGTNIAALDAHYGVSQTYAFYLANFNRNSYNGAGAALYSYVNDPTYTDNAFWDGSAMNFNKRSNSTTNPGGVTGIDVTGHELTHGVTQSTCNLTYSKEPGAMNESMSDIMGKSVQFWSKPTDVNWLMSNDMNWLIRSMSNPNTYGQPDTYKGTYWTTSSADNYGVHTNSGVGNFMFYLLVNGGSGTNDIGNSYSVTGIGLSEADQIIYRTQTVYLVSNSQYADWRTACINAATDLYGAASPEVASVQNAWYAVGIGTAAGGGGTCNAPASLASSAITSTTATVSWAAASGALSYNLQYKTAASGTWTTVSGIAGTSYNLTGLTASTAYNFQVATVCASGTSAYSAPASFTTTSSGGITYCTSAGTTTYEYINKVLLGTINNTSGNNSGYGNFTGISTNLTAGAANSITLTPGFSSSSYREYWAVFIDYNRDGVLNGSGETVATGNGTAAISKSFTVPATAKNGATRMRIVMHYGSSRTNPCGSYTYGEVEDYTVNISGGTGFAAIASTADDAMAANKTVNISIAPNPVAGSNAAVSYNLTGNGKTALQVINADGRIVRSVQLGNQSAGSHNHTLTELNQLSSGTYILQLDQNGQAITRKRFVVIK